jgi:cell division protein FtsI/penicillin-binding protein 2
MAIVTPQQKKARAQVARRWLAWALIGAVALLAGFQARALAMATTGAAAPGHEPDDPPADPEEEVAAKAAEAPKPEGDPDDEGEPEGDDEPTLYADEKPLQLEHVPAGAADAAATAGKHLTPAGVELWRKSKLIDGHYQSKLADGRKANLSIDPRLQQTLQKLLESYKPMSGSVVAMDPKTGQLLAMVEYAKDGRAQGLATRPLYPAASVFKIITGAALLEKGISPEAETCYHGGVHGLVGKLLQDKPRLDRRCLSLSMALAKSANVVFGKLAVRHLDAATLRKEAEKFLFNRPIWSQTGVEQSIAQIPDGADPLEFAKSAAGFGRVRLSAMHAAVIAAAVANDGVAVEPTLLHDVDGEAQGLPPAQRLLNAETARRLREMMKLTVSDGTARHSFRERRRWALGDIEVGGKTGSLADKKPFRDYSWFVGFAPADNPRIAVAAIVVNSQLWRIKAPYVAREAMRAYLIGDPPGEPPSAKARVHKRRRARKPQAALK